MSLRLDRRIAERTGASRREVGRWIRTGRVQVGGSAVTDPAYPIHGEAPIAIDGSPLPAAPSPIVLYHKPLGVHSTLADDHGRSDLGTVARALVDAGLHPVGRLDADTDGLLLFSSDGRWTQWLLHPRRAIERVYLATVDPAPGPDLGPRLAAGVETAEGTFSADVRAIDGPRVTLAVGEGKYRMVRRILANAGHPVRALRRLSYGPFTLGDLPAGAWRDPTEAEWAALAQLRGTTS